MFCLVIMLLICNALPLHRLQLSVRLIVDLEGVGSDDCAEMGSFT